MFEFAYVGVAGGIIQPCTFASFSATGAGATVQSSNNTITVGAGNTGDLQIVYDSESGTVALEYSKNEAAFANAETSPTVNFVTGDRLRMQITGTVLGESATFYIRDVTTNMLFGPYTLEDTI